MSEENINETEESLDEVRVKIVEKDIPIGDGLQKYMNEGVEHLYIDADERLRFINRTSKAVVGELERDDLSSEERIEITQQGMGIVAEDIFENNIYLDSL